MEQKTREMLTSHIFELFDTGEEAISFLNESGLEENQYLLRDLEVLCTAIASAVDQLIPEIELENKLKEIGLNAPLTVSRLSRTLEEGNVEGAYMQYNCALVPLFLFWRRYAEFFLLHAADEEAMANWHEEERQRLRQIREMPKQDEPQEYRYDFSVIVLFYGKQKMTKECLDSIEAYTKSRSYELITFDNGSDPETTAWCEGLPHVKKIYYPHNMGSSAAGNLIFTMAPYYIEGKYLLYVSNDVVVTPQYDEILYRCMESDPRIAMAVPVCNSGNNLQEISVPYKNNNLNAMQSFAKRYNHCDPAKWAERSRLFTILACIRIQPLCQRELAYDPLFCYDMFADDDFSLALRRMGYRQVLCNDVFVHHYGAASIGKVQFQIMKLARAQFRQKHGVDAWTSLATDLHDKLTCFSIKETNLRRVLVLNPMFGESALALCNQLKVCGCKGITVDALTEDPRYLEDMEGLFHRSGLLQEAEQVLEGQYDIALVGCNLGWCSDLRAVLHVAASRLNSQGLLMTQYENFFSLTNLNAALEGSLPADSRFVHDPEERLDLRIITDDVLASFMQREGMKLAAASAVKDNIWAAADTVVEQILTAFHIQQKETAKKHLLNIGEFDIWEKQS